MKVLITAAGVAVLAIVLFEISMIEAQNDNRRCPDDRRPPLNTTEVKCDRGRRPGHGFAVLACIIRCRQCYNRTQLQPLSGCLVDNKCQCLANSSSSGGGRESSTTESAVDLTTSSGDNEQQPSSQSSITGNPGSENPSVTSGEGEATSESPVSPGAGGGESTSGQGSTGEEGAADQTTSATT